MFYFHHDMQQLPIHTLTHTSCSVPLHHMHVFDATLHLHLHCFEPDTVCCPTNTSASVALSRAIHNAYRQEQGVPCTVLQFHSVSAVLIHTSELKACNKKIKKKQKKKTSRWLKMTPLESFICAWLTTHPSTSPFCLRERKPLSHTCQKAGGNNSPGGVSHWGPPAEPGTPRGGELEPSPSSPTQNTSPPLYLHSCLAPQRWRSPNTSWFHLRGFGGDESRLRFSLAQVQWQCQFCRTATTESFVFYLALHCCLVT